MLAVPALVVKVYTVEARLDDSIAHPARIGADGLFAAVAREVIDGAARRELVVIVRRVGMEDKACTLLVTRFYHVLIGYGMRLGRRDAHPQVHDVDAVGQADDALAPRGGILVAAGALDGCPVGIIHIADLVLAGLVVAQRLIILLAVLLERLQIQCLRLGITSRDNENK